ncbi:hypothetical protein LU632_05665 [Erwinia tracheiphila]|uniref:hypothetical protein n=1 Tax=Erwinia tracheiphila TaxID=65700 RepID=UPI001F264FDD|nr:hypothetical protein [Erwinia tracheiphila]UIA93061.1 hypothetical protein LU632_05665 [Erwinia tracheiphila]
MAVDAQSAIEDATSPDDALTEVMNVVDGAAADIVEAEQILEDAALNGVEF